MSLFGNSDLFAGFELPEEDQNALSDDSYEELNHVKEENLQLKAENEELRKALRVITQPSNIRIQDASRDGPIAHVLLFNNPLARQEKERIEEFFFNVSQGHCNGEYPYDVQPSAIRCPRLKSPRTSSRSSKAFTITDSVQVYTGRFCLDQLGEPLLHGYGPGSYIPNYERAHLDAMDGEEPVDEKEQKKPKRICFNCGEGNHQLKDCPTPKNFKLINQRKQQFLGSMSNPLQSGSNRYHAENEVDETDPRFASFRPGIISETLKRALGMKKYDLPPYIYQMRMMGYPPGHLEEARIATSGLSFYSGRNKKAEDIDPDLEEGPVDVNKIIEYPGFNIKADSCVIDHCEELGAVPMDESHSKDKLVSYHKHRNALLKRKAEGEKCGTDNEKRRKKDHHHKTDDITEVDMETSDDGGPDVKEVSTKDEESMEATMDLSGVEEGEVEDVGCGDEEVEGDGDAGDLDEVELQIKREMILHQLRLQEETANLIKSPVDEMLPSNTASDNSICGDASGNDSPKVVEECIEVEEIIQDDSVQDKSQILTLDRDSPSDNVLQANTETHLVDSKDETKFFSTESTSICNNLDSPTDSTSLFEGPKFPGESTSIHESPDKSSSYHENPKLPGDSTSIHDSSVSPEESTSIYESPESPGESASIYESPESPEESTSIHESPESPGESASIYESPESPGGSTSIHESPESPGASTFLSESPEKSSYRHENPTSPEESTSHHNSPDSRPIEKHLDKELGGSGFDQNSSCEKPNIASQDKETIPVHWIPESTPVEKETTSTMCLSFVQDSTKTLVSDEPGIPHRSKFAEGITQFGLYHEETKSRGVYTKLRTLLKNSPRRSSKNP